MSTYEDVLALARTVAAERPQRSGPIGGDPSGRYGWHLGLITSGWNRDQQEEWGREENLYLAQGGEFVVTVREFQHPHGGTADITHNTRPVERSDLLAFDLVSMSVEATPVTGQTSVRAGHKWNAPQFAEDYRGLIRLLEGLRLSEGAA